MSSSNNSLRSNHKRPRIELSAHAAMRSDTYNLSEVMQNRSPYEQKINKIIRACPKCYGEGKVRGSLSKKAKARKKEIQSTDTKNIQALPKKPCKECNGTGLIAHDPTSDPNLHLIEKATNFTVAIIGGGIGGIALAAALQHRNIPCVVYERDLSFEERNQGYGLTMQQGARALRSLGFFSFDDADNREEENGNSLKFGIHSTRHAVHNPDGSILGEWGLRVWGARYEKNGRGHATRQNAHISRQGLRRVLMDMVRPGTVRWGYKFLGYESSTMEDECDNDARPLKLKFIRRLKGSDGNETYAEVEVAASILAGCDGIRSVVRASKLGEEIAPLRYLDCIVILGIGPSPENSELTDGKTVFQTADGVTRLYAMPFAEPGEEVRGLERVNERGLSMWQLSFPMEEFDAIELSRLGPAALKAEALRRCGVWHDPIPRLLKSTPEALVTGYPCYDRALVNKEALRVGHNKSRLANAYITLLGDAAHPMSPFKGQGANQALLDSVLLAQKLYSAVRKNEKTDSTTCAIPNALAEFEDEMFQRCAVKVKKSADAAKFLHSEVAIAEGNVTRGAAAAGFEDTDEVKSTET